MSSDPYAVLAVIAQVLGTACFIPQLLRTWRTRSAHDFSWWSLGLSVVAASCLTAYFVLDGSYLLALGQIPTLLSVLALSVMRALYGRPVEARSTNTEPQAPRRPA